VVELERLRPPGSRKPANFTRRVFRIPPGQEANVKITEHHLPKLAKLAQLFALNISPDGKSLVGAGVQRSLETAQGLLDMPARYALQEGASASAHGDARGAAKEADQADGRAQEGCRLTRTFARQSSPAGAGRHRCL
jgi:hypothetical protein